MRTGGEILAECLSEQGVKTIFGVPGESYLAVLDALVDHKDIRLIGNRNEGGAAFMACAHGQLTGQPGICFVTRGPGATNASIGVHTAMQGSNPMILFIGQVGTDMRGREAFQEVDYRAYFGPIAKWVTEIDEAARIPETIARAFTVAQSGRPGPVVIALPEDMLRSRAKAKPAPKVQLFEPAPVPEAIYELQKAFGRAERPLLLIGGGGWQGAGRADLQAFVERNNLPVASAFRFQDLLANHSESYIGDAGLGKTPAMKAALEQADLIFALNIRFGENTTDGYETFNVPRIGRPLIHSHASDLELGKIYQADLPIHAGPNALCKVLAGLDLRGNWQGWAEAQRKAYEQSMVLPIREHGVDMAGIIAYLQGRLPDDAILTNGAGNFAIWHNKFFRYGAGARLLAPQSGAMGYGLPAAIAAKAEHPERLVLCFAGDGDFQMNMQELGAAMQARAQPVIIVVNNGTYGTIKMHQERTYPGRTSFTDIENPDFCAIAQAYGFHAETVTETLDFFDAFCRAAASSTGALIELVIDPEYITPKATLSDIRG